MENIKIQQVEATEHPGEADSSGDKPVEGDDANNARSDVDSPETAVNVGVSEAMLLWHKQLPPKLHVLYLKTLKQLAKAAPELAVGSACSGSDIYWKVSEMLVDFLGTEHGVHLNFKHAMAAENDEKKISFLRSQFPLLRVLLQDVSDLNKPRPPNRVNHKPCFVPHLDGFIAGFSCASRAKVNCKRGQFKDCLQKQQSCSTNDTFEPIALCIMKTRPRFFLLENVEGITEKSKDEEMSDCDWICSQMRAEGFWCEPFVIEAQDYGSVPVRKRVYIMGVLLTEDTKPLYCEFSAFATQMLNSMVIGPGLVH